MDIVDTHAFTSWVYQIKDVIWIVSEWCAVCEVW